MNLLDFRNRIISSDPNKIETDSFFSEEITIFNIYLQYDFNNSTKAYNNKGFSLYKFSVTSLAIYIKMMYNSY